MVQRSIGLATALNPHIGYAKASEIAQRAYETGKSIREIVLDEKLLKADELDEILSPQNMMQPRSFSRKK